MSASACARACKYETHNRTASNRKRAQNHPTRNHRLRLGWMERMMPNESKLSDGGWRRKTRDTEKTPPPASVRWSAWLGVLRGGPIRPCPIVTNHDENLGSEPTVRKRLSNSNCQCVSDVGSTGPTKLTCAGSIREEYAVAGLRHDMSREPDACEINVRGLVIFTARLVKIKGDKGKITHEAMTIAQSGSPNDQSSGAAGGASNVEFRKKDRRPRLSPGAPC